MTTWGVVVPSTNTMLQCDIGRLGPGTQTRMAAVPVGSASMQDQAAFEALIGALREGIGACVSALAGSVDIAVLGMSPGVAWEDAAAETNWLRRFIPQGMRAVSAGLACIAALSARRVARIGIVTPAGSRSVELARAYFERSGFTVTGATGLAAASGTAAGSVGVEDLSDAIGRVASGADAVVQLGTNVPWLAHLPRLSSATGVPLVPVNGALIWQGLRVIGDVEVEVDPLETARRLAAMVEGGTPATNIAKP